MFGMERLNNFPIDGTRETFAQSWTAYFEQYSIDRKNTLDDLADDTLNFYTLNTATRVNSYDICDLQWRPFFVEELERSRKYAIPTAYTVPDCILSADWTLRQRAPGLPDYNTNINVPPTQAATPELPFRFEDKTAIIDYSTYSDGSNRYSLHSSDGTTIYYSTVVRRTTPGPGFLSQVFGLYDIYDSRAWGLPTFTEFLGTSESTRRSCSGGAFFGRGRNQPPDYAYEFYAYYGLYWTYTPATDQSTFRAVLLRSGSDVEIGINISSEETARYLNNQDPRSPHYQLWFQAKNNSSFSESFFAQDWLFQNFGIIFPNKNTWRPGLVYYKDTGLLVMTTRTAGTDDYRIFTQTVDPGLAYSTAVIYLPLGYNPLLTTDQNFFNAGWVLDRVITTPFSTDLLNYVAHRP